MDQRTVPVVLLHARPLRTVNSIIVVHGLSSFCFGLVFPYTSIYLSDLPQVGTGGVAIYYGVSGLSNLAVALVLATGLLKPPRVALGVIGNLLSCGGYLTLSMVDSLPLVGVAGVINGAGQGCFLAAIIPIVNSLVSEANRRRVFARRYQVLNATLAAGSLVAGLVTATLSKGAIHFLLLVNAAGYLPIAATLLLRRKAIRAGEEAKLTQQSASASGSAVPTWLLFKTASAVTVFQLGVYLFGYSQFEATMPLVTDKLMHLGLGVISVLIAVNVGVIVAAQSWVTRLLEPKSEVFGVRAAIGMWTCGYLVVGLTALTGPPFALVGIIVYAVLFALGECAYSCSYHPWLISRVPEQDLTRANALSNSMMGIGMFLGPTIGVGLVSRGYPSQVWLALMALCATVAVATIELHRWKYSGQHRPRSPTPLDVVGVPEPYASVDR